MREYIKRLNAYLGDKVPLHGHSGQVDEQVEALAAICKNLDEKGDVVEVGFNAGHSAAIFLENTDKNVISFDILEEGNIADVAKEYIDMTYPNRHTLVVGDSRTTVPQFDFENGISAIYIDGNHSYEYAKADIINCLDKAKSGTVIIVDDILTMGYPCDEGPGMAWRESLLDLNIYETGQIDFNFWRGMAWGYVL